jgi:CDP-diacylglycerol--inositol 3-phosphatidyltransferase
MMDMVTDRCAGIGLMMTLAWRFPKYHLVCHFFIWLDICSHWAHQFYQLACGHDSHKMVKAGPRLLQYYYRTNWFMVTLIIGAEGFPLCLYVMSFPIGPGVTLLAKISGAVFFPLFALKHIINVMQFWWASIMLDHKKVGRDTKK